MLKNFNVFKSIKQLTNNLKEQFNKNKREIQLLIIGVILNFVLFVLLSKILHLNNLLSSFISYLSTILFLVLFNKYLGKYTKKQKIAIILFSLLIKVFANYLVINIMKYNILIYELISFIIQYGINYILLIILFYKDKKIKSETYQYNCFNKWIENVVKLVSTIAAIYILYLNINTYNLLFIFLVYVIILITIKVNVKKIFDKFNKIWIFLDKYFAYILFFVALLIRYIIISKINIEIQSDFAVVYNAAMDLVKGINNIKNEPYFLRWGYQTGMVLYQTIIMGLFKNVNILHLIDCIYNSMVCVFIYLIAKEFFSKKASQIVAILYTIIIYVISFCGVVSNHHIFAFYIFLYLLIAKRYRNMNYIVKFFIIGLLLAIANIHRSESIVYVLAIIAFVCMYGFNKKYIKKCFLSLLIMLFTYSLIGNIASFAIRDSGINPSGLDNKIVLWKFVCGTDYNAGGGYSEAGVQYLYDEEKSKEFIINNLKSLDFYQYINFIETKEREFWNVVPYYWVFNKYENENIVLFGKTIPFLEFRKIIELYDKFIFSIGVICFTIYTLFQNKKHSKKINLIYLMILSNFFIYLFIEVNGRYSYLAKALIFILAAGGIDYVIKKQKNKFIIDK